MSMTLHRFGRTELLRQMRQISDTMGSYPKSEVVSIDRHGRKTSVVKVEERPNGVFVFLFEPDSPSIAIAPLMGSRMRYYDVPDFISELGRCAHEDVWLQWPDDDPHTVIGKILGMGHGDTLSVSLMPVPDDIEEVNLRVHDIVSRECEEAKLGLECGDCPFCGTCEVLERADREVTPSDG